MAAVTICSDFGAPKIKSDRLLTATAKSLQSCPTLCDPRDGSPLWDSPGKNTGVGCHFLLQCMKVKIESEVAQSCLNPSDPMDCSLPGSSVDSILKSRDVTLPTEVHLVKAMVFPVVMYGCESWTIRKVER